MESIFALLLLLAGMTWALGRLLFGPRGGTKIVTFLLQPFGCILKICGLILLLCLAGILLINKPSTVQRGNNQQSNEEPISTNQKTAPIQEPSSLLWPLPEKYHKLNQLYGQIWSYNSSKRHTGIDIKAPKETEVYAAKGGNIKLKMTLMNGSEDKKNWGYCIVIAHDNNTWTTSYLHIRPSPELRVGSEIDAHYFLGWVYYDHLHFGIRRHAFDNFSMRGALPIKTVPNGDPVFPEYFADPKNFTYQIPR